MSSMDPPNKKLGNPNPMLLSFSGSRSNSGRANGGDEIGRVVAPSNNGGIAAMWFHLLVPKMHAMFSLPLLSIAIFDAICSDEKECQTPLGQGEGNYSYWKVENDVVSGVHLIELHSHFTICLVFNFFSFSNH